MTFRVNFSPTARKDFEAMPHPVQIRIVHALERSADDPFRAFKRLKGRADASLRVGEYRVLADLVLGENLIWVHAVGHRRNVYD